MMHVIPFLLMALYFLVIVGGFVFLAVLLYLALKAHQSIAESLKIIAERMNEKT